MNTIDVLIRHSQLTNEPLLTTKTLALLYGPRGLAKTFVAMGIAWAVASGSSFLGRHAARPPRGVLSRRRDGRDRDARAPRAVRPGARSAQVHARRSGQGDGRLPEA